MKVTSIVFKEHQILGIDYDAYYREPDYFTVTADGITREVCVDITQCTYSMVKPILAEALKRKFGDKCENIDEAFQMYWKTLPSKYKPFSGENGVTQFR